MLRSGGLTQLACTILHFALLGWWNEQLTGDRAFATALKYFVRANVRADASSTTSATSCP